MPPTTHKIENAKSGQSKCKRCKESIAKGELRIQSNAESETTGMHFTHNYHTSCFKVPPRAMAGVSPADFVDEHLEDCSKDKVLLDPTTLQEVIDDIAITTNGAKKKPTKKKKATKKKRSTTEDDEDEEEYRPTKEAKKATAVKSEEVSEEETSDVGEKEEKEEESPVVPQQQWVGCESCGKWRKLPDHISPDSLPDEWLCNMNDWDAHHATCEAPEEA